MRTHLTTPGDVLKSKVLKRYDLTQDELAKALGVSRFSVNQVLNSRRAVTPEMAVRLGHVLDTSPEVWLNLQMAVDIAEAQRSLSKELRGLKKLRTANVP